MGRIAIVLALGLCAACGAAEAQSRRDISKATFKGEWPFTMSAGILACEPPGSNVVFVAAGKTYAINGTARGSAQMKRGAWADGETITAEKPLGPIQNPVTRMPLNRRKAYFAEAVTCEDDFPPGPRRKACESRLQKLHALTVAEGRSIIEEGLTTGWPPLKPMHASVSDIISAGLALCK